MARPTKQGLDYFPMDVEADTDEKVEYLIAKCGFLAFGVYVKLLMAIYKNGYFLEWSDRTLFVFAKRAGVEPEEISKIIDGCIDAELFDKDIYAKNKVLTSASIQKRFLTATEKRRAASIGLYSLLEVNPKKTGVNSEKTTVNSEKTGVNSENVLVITEKSTQSKVKKSKVNKTTTTTLSQTEKERELSEVVSEYEDGICPLHSMREREMLIDLFDTYGAEKVKAAIRAAIRANARKLAYIEGCLRNWANGITTNKSSPSQLDYPINQGDCTFGIDGGEEHDNTSGAVG